MKSTRNAVYASIDGERRYQFQNFGDVFRSKGDIAIYIGQYLEELKNDICYDEQRAQHSLRKIAALAVFGLEMHGTPTREEEQASLPFGNFFSTLNTEGGANKCG